MNSPQIYTKANPFLAKITKRVSLCKPGSLKSTFHIVIDITGSGISYRVGDSVAIFPENDPEVVEKIVQLLGCLGDELICDRHSNTFLIREYLLKQSNLAEVPRKLILFLAQHQTDNTKKERLEFLISEGQKESLKEFQETNEVLDALMDNREVVFDPQEFCLLLQPLLPRFYSIASSMLSVGHEVHLTVAELTYETNGLLRRGTCTYYLCHQAPLNESVVPIYIHPSQGFTLPENENTSIIMIGPGTGIAPYVGFMQERKVKNASGHHWLFFGECYQETEFYYEEFWLKLLSEGHFRMDLAFSRDQENKIYVQDRLLERSQEIFEWLQNGAHLYVCGDAHHMAKDVDAALHQIIQEEGQLDEKSAKEYVKQLKKDKRYLRDVY